MREGETSDVEERPHTRRVIDEVLFWLSVCTLLWLSVRWSVTMSEMPVGGGGW